MIKFFQKLKARKGFTLVELIVVIAIIGVLAAILIPVMLGYVTSSKVQSANSTAAEIKNAINNWITEMDTKGYATNKSAKGTDATPPTIKVETTAAGVVTVTFAGSVWSSGVDATAQGQLKTNLETKLKNDFNFKKMGAFAYLDSGKVVGVAYTADDDTAPTTPGFADLTAASGTYAWGDTEGIGSGGIVIGTSPILTKGLS